MELELLVRKASVKMAMCSRGPIIVGKGLATWVFVVSGRRQGVMPGTWQLVNAVMAHCRNITPVPAGPVICRSSSSGLAVGCDQPFTAFDRGMR